MEKGCLTIPQDSLFDMLKYQPESVLIQLFEKLIVSSDTSTLTVEEQQDINFAKEEYYNGETISWKK